MGVGGGQGWIWKDKEVGWGGGEGWIWEDKEVSGGEARGGYGRIKKWV